MAVCIVRRSGSFHDFLKSSFFKFDDLFIIICIISYHCGSLHCMVLLLFPFIIAAHTLVFIVLIITLYQYVALLPGSDVPAGCWNETLLH